MQLKNKKNNNKQRERVQFVTVVLIFIQQNVLNVCFAYSSFLFHSPPLVLVLRIFAFCVYILRFASFKVFTYTYVHMYIFCASIRSFCQKEIKFYYVTHRHTCDLFMPPATPPKGKPKPQQRTLQNLILSSSFGPPCNHRGPFLTTSFPLSALDISFLLHICMNVFGVVFGTEI